MEWLFQVPDGRRVRITSRLIRWVDDDGTEREIGRDVTWAAITTAHYWKHNGTYRRLLIDHTLEYKPEVGIWHADIECFVIG